MASSVVFIWTSLVLLVLFQTVFSDDPPPTTTLSPSTAGGGFSAGSGASIGSRGFFVGQVAANPGFTVPYGRSAQQQQFMAAQQNPYARTYRYHIPGYKYHVNIIRVPYYYPVYYTVVPPPMRYFFTNFEAGNEQYDFSPNDNSATVGGDGGAVISFGGGGSEGMQFGDRSGSMLAMSQQQMQQQQMQQQQMQQQQMQQQQMQQQQMQQQQMQQQQMQQQEQAAFAARENAARQQATASHWAMKGAHVGGGGFSTSFSSGMMGGSRFATSPQVSGPIGSGPVGSRIGPGPGGPQVHSAFA